MILVKSSSDRSVRSSISVDTAIEKDCSVSSIISVGAAVEKERRRVSFDEKRNQYFALDTDAQAKKSKNPFARRHHARVPEDTWFTCTELRQFRRNYNEYLDVATNCPLRKSFAKSLHQLLEMARSMEALTTEEQEKLLTSLYTCSKSGKNLLGSFLGLEYQSSARVKVTLSQIRSQKTDVVGDIQSELTCGLCSSTAEMELELQKSCQEISQLPTALAHLVAVAQSRACF